MRSAALLALIVTVAGCAAAGPPAPSRPPGPMSAAERHQQVMRDVAAMAEGMAGARLSKVRRAGL